MPSASSLASEHAMQRPAAVQQLYGAARARRSFDLVAVLARFFPLRCRFRTTCSDFPLLRASVRCRLSCSDGAGASRLDGNSVCPGLFRDWLSFVSRSTTGAGRTVLRVQKADGLLLPRLPTMSPPHVLTVR